MVGTQPKYLHTPLPLGGRFGSKVTQTINVTRLDCGGTYATTEEAVQGGLEDLRKALGW
jgi:hypothetical protein